MGMPKFGNVLVGLSLFALVLSEAHKQEYKDFTIDDPKLCSPITKRKVRHESLVVNQGKRLSTHSIPWNIPYICKFEVQSLYPKGGILAVIQKLNLRKNMNGDCIDYIQFRAKGGTSSQRHCGYLDASIIMNFYEENFEQPPAISFRNSFIDPEGELDVVIFIAKEPLGFTERTEIVVAFTSFKACSQPHSIKHITLVPCNEDDGLRCINQNFFNDGYINCPDFGCVDEGGCQQTPKDEPKESIGNRVIISSISTLAILFTVFIFFIWIFKKHKLLCWAEDFAHPTPTPESNRNSRVMELNENTGRRLAATQNPDIATAPIEDDKDLPPSYESLFPNTS